MLHCFTDLQALYIRSGVLEFSSCVKPPLSIFHQSSKIILKNIKVVVAPGAVKLLKPDTCLIAAYNKDAVLSLKNCTIETAADSPQLMQLTAVAVGQGAQVRPGQHQQQG
jgi:hypothetical protein